MAGEKSGVPNRNELNKANNRDAYVQLNWHLMDAQGHSPFTLTGGWRHSDVRLQSRDDYLADGQDGSGQVRYQASSPVLGLTWHAQDTLNVYANWGRGFETPTLAEAAYAITGTGSSRSIRGLFNPDLLAARSRHLEAGFKWTPAPGSKVDAAFFHIATDNEIVASLSDSGKTAYVNASRTSRQGAELFWQQNWGGQWRTLLSASWLQAQYDAAFTSTSKVGSTYTAKTIPAGNRLPGIPEQQLWASLQWAQAGYATSAPQGLSASLDWAARSALWAADMNDAASRAPGYGLLNVRVRHRMPWGVARVESWLGIDNLMDRRYAGSVIVNQAAAQFFEPGLPRSWVGGLKVSVPL